jgi:hypothetical protein
MKRLALIGDIHSQIAPLQSAWQHCQDHNLTPLFLGDLFDSRTDTSDTVAVYNLVRKIQEQTGAIVLNSNHQDKLMRVLRGNPVRLDFVPELKRSLAEFDEAGVDREELLEWLIGCPHGYVFRDSAGTEYRCAHALFPSWVEVPEYEVDYCVGAVGNKAKDLMLYGPRNRETRQRVEWWLLESQREFVRVSGHYHVVHTDSKSLVLDSGCGGGAWVRDAGALSLWDVERQELTAFPASSAECAN